MILCVKNKQSSVEIKTKLSTRFFIIFVF